MKNYKVPKEIAKQVSDYCASRAYKLGCNNCMFKVERKDQPFNACLFDGMKILFDIEVEPKYIEQYKKSLVILKLKKL